MSIEWMTHVWNNSKQKGSQLLMLLAIADYADEKGEAFPSIETLAQRTRQTNRNAIRILEKIEASHELTSVTYASPYGTNLYRLHVPITPKPKKSASKRSSDILGTKSAESSDIPVPQMSPNPSLTISNTPTKESAGKPRAISNPITKEIQAAYQSVYGAPVLWTNGNGHAAKWLADNGYTAEDVIGCYKNIAADPWWNGRSIHLSSVIKQIGAWKNKNKTASSNESIRGRKEYV